jgi:hypothetical protein
MEIIELSKEVEEQLPVEVQKIRKFVRLNQNEQ